MRTLSLAMAILVSVGGAHAVESANPGVSVTEKPKASAAGKTTEKVRNVSPVQGGNTRKTRAKTSAATTSSASPSPQAAIQTLGQTGTTETEELVVPASPEANPALPFGDSESGLAPSRGSAAPAPGMRPPTGPETK